MTGFRSNLYEKQPGPSQKWYPDPTSKKDLLFPLSQHLMLKIVETDKCLKKEVFVYYGNLNPNRIGGEGGGGVKLTMPRKI